MLDNKVNWKDHINYISGKVSHGFGMILKARRSLTKKSMNDIILFIHLPLSDLLISHLGFNLSE